MLCPDCEVGRLARAMFLADHPWSHLGTALTPFAMCALGGMTMRSRLRASPLVTAGVVLGVGLGGFVDGILLHQILQWHEMLSSVTPPTTLVAVKYNMIWDGLFHAFTWIVTVIGVGLLFRAARHRDREPWSGPRLVGAMIAGWGLFDLVEGVIDHLILGIHHVHPGRAEAAWDWGFVTLGGIVLIAIGLWIVRHEGMTPATHRV
jgi:uncharacterized membrane protein